VCSRGATRAAVSRRRALYEGDWVIGRAGVGLGRGAFGLLDANSPSRCDLAALYAAFACATAESMVSRTADVACSLPHLTADAMRSACAVTSSATFRLCLRRYARESRPLAGAIINAATAPMAVPATNIMIEPLQDDDCGS
jgi:hypothetical protein